MKPILRLVVIAISLLFDLSVQAQEFFNLTAEQVRVDSLLPVFNYERELGSAYSDSVYTVSIEYPEFIDMSTSDINRCKQLMGGDTLPTMPAIEQYIGVSRKRGTLYVQFVPLVFREGRYRKLVSFMLKVKSSPAPRSRRAAVEGSRYADHSVLASGNWAKIRVPSTGIYQLTESLIRKAGFTDLSKVKVYGYGGALQPEQLKADYLVATDDLQEVPTCIVGGHRLFYAVGPVGWESANSTARIRNPYSDYGYYFLTEGDNPLMVDEETFTKGFYPSAYDYHSLYEVDDYAWFHGGRNLYDSKLFGVDRSHSYTLPSSSTDGRLTVVMSYDEAFQATLHVNGQQVGTMTVSVNMSTGLPEGRDSYSKAASKTWTFNVDDLQPTNTITITQTSGGNLRLDYLSLCFSEPTPLPDLATSSFEVPEYVYNITNQDHHADTAVDMVIIIPTTQKLLAQAQRLKQLHEEHDGLRVRIVPADELYNEFASGTPDANAYRRYLKMLYDRAEVEADMPRFLLLLGDGAWDNRMLSVDWRGYSPDDFLLCYESDNSFSETDCYVTDDYFCLMDDGEGRSLATLDKSDLAVGRIPARNQAEAQIMVDKTIGYIMNEYAGAWQNKVCFMGDDGDYNRHMGDAESVASLVQKRWPDLQLNRIYWDAYQRTSSSTGFSYPDVTRLIQQQMKEGALMMNYTGHGAPYIMSHEQVLNVTDFAASTSLRLPIWLTASCDIMPFDGQEENIGETAMMNKNGGAVAFYGTTRTVYSHYNRYMNLAFTGYVLDTATDGRRYTIGEAARLAKNKLLTPRNDVGTDYTANKLQYTLLGDPALKLAMPTAKVVIDDIRSVTNGSTEGETSDGGQSTTQLKAGQRVMVSGYVADEPTFNGTVTLTVKDVEQLIVCRMNSTEKIDTAFVFRDRPNTLYSGSDSVRNGRFQLTFALPRDISYTDGTGLMTAYAVNNEKTVEANGRSEAFTMTGDVDAENDGIGPSIWCYLNSPSFTNGSHVNPTPYFYAELNDNDGINASGSGIGHDLELIIDGEMARTYNLNNYFSYDFGDYRRGAVGYSIPKLDYGEHRLLFRAWDVLNNSSQAELVFTVSKALEPQCFDVNVTKNPAITGTTFVVTHDRTGSEIDVEIDVYDASGRLLWKHSETGVSTNEAYTVDWDLTTDGGRRLQTGVYLYRMAVSSDGSRQASKARKLIILGNN